MGLPNGAFAAQHQQRHEDATRYFCSDLEIEQAARIMPGGRELVTPVLREPCPRRRGCKAAMNVCTAAKEASDWANDKMKTGESGYLIELQRKGMQVVIPDAGSFRTRAKPVVEELFKTEWSVTTWADVLAQ
jgi:hypothetical protein